MEQQSSREWAMISLTGCFSVEFVTAYNWNIHRNVRVAVVSNFLFLVCYGDRWQVTQQRGQNQSLVTELYEMNLIQPPCLCRSGGWLFYDPAHPRQFQRRPRDSCPWNTHNYMQVRVICSGFSVCCCGCFALCHDKDQAGIHRRPRCKNAQPTTAKIVQSDPILQYVKTWWPSGKALVL